MEKIKLTFLGTGSAIPTKRHNHPAVLLQYKSENILVDCGEGTQRQFRIAHLNPCKLTRILITHWHGDHVLGLPGLFQTLMLNGYNKTLKIYGPRGTKKMLQLYLALFTHKGKLKTQIHEISSGTIVNEKDFQIQAAPMNHDTPTNAYSFITKQKSRLNKQKLRKLKLPHSPLLAKLQKGKTIKIDGRTINPKKHGLLFREQGRKITFIMDTKINPRAIKLAKNSDILVSETTYGADEKKIASEHKHLTSTDAGNIAKSSHSKKLIITHLSQRYETKEKSKQILNQTKKIFKNTSVADDFDVVEI